MVHLQLVFAAIQVQWVSYHYLVFEAARCEQVSEFAADEEMEKQAKQSYKHEVHLLVPNDHFVVPARDSLGWEKAAALEMEEEEKTRLLLEIVVAGMEDAAAVSTTADMVEVADHKEVAEAEDFGHKQWEGHRN